MRKSTVESKLNALFGLTEKAKEVKAKTTGRVVGVTESEIQEFREAQGLIYFFQAPELFSFKVCPHCGENFYVSRKYVGFCSYTCIEKDLETKGIKWRKGKDIEALVNDPHVYEGNEPIWIRSRNLLKVKAMLESLPNDLLEKMDAKQLSEDRIKLQQAAISESLAPSSQKSTSSSVNTTTKSGRDSTSSSRKRKPVRRVISAT